MKNAPLQNWIFLRGLSREAAHWGEFPAAFEKRFAGTRVFTIDLPGNGEFCDVSTPLTLSGLLEFVRAEWAKRNPAPGQPVYLFGMSLGAMVCLQWMQSYPDEVSEAVFINTSLRGFSPFFRRMSPSAYLTLVRTFFDRSAKSREKRILALTSQHREWSEAELIRRAEIQRKHPVGKVNAFRQVVAALSTVDKKQKPTQPVLILNSLGDLLVHPDCSKTIADTWQIPLRRHAWAGHDLTLDDPEWTLNALADWFATQAPPKKRKKN